jgi:hypothetical protein
VGVVVGSINDVGAIVRRELQPRDFAAEKSARSISATRSNLPA